MVKTLVRLISACGWLVACASAQTGDGSDAEAFWPHWRGPLQNGVAPSADPPIQWSEEENVRWKVPVPGIGHASPIVWGDLVFVTTAVAYGEHGEPVPDDLPGAHDNAPVTQHHEFAAVAFDRGSGEVVWSRTLRKQLPHAGAHGSASLASNSPATDGEHLFAFFGSHGLYCLGFDGELIWERDLGVMEPKHGHGEGASVLVQGDAVIVNWDHEGQSFVVALDKKTGDELWRADRDEVTSWSSPISVEFAGKQQVVVSGTKRIRAYDLESGDVIWECGGMANNIVASPVAGHGMVFAGSSYKIRKMLAIRLEGAKGDVTGTDNVVWSRRRGTPYVPSPLLYGKWLYFLYHYQGILTRVEATTGKEAGGPFRLDELYDIYASPVGAAGRIYVTDRSGTTLVLSHGDGAPEVLARNHLQDQFSASAAVAGRELFLRGERYLYCLAADE